MCWHEGPWAAHHRGPQAWGRPLKKGRGWPSLWADHPPTKLSSFWVSGGLSGPMVGAVGSRGLGSGLGHSFTPTPNLPKQFHLSFCPRTGPEVWESLGPSSEVSPRCAGGQGGQGLCLLPCQAAASLQASGLDCQDFLLATSSGPSLRRPSLAPFVLEPEGHCWVLGRPVCRGCS